MSNRKTFNDFKVRLKPKQGDFLVGFDSPEVGGESKFQLNHLKDFIHAPHILNINQSQVLPLAPPPMSDQAGDAPAPPPFLNGKIFHVRGEHDVEITLPNFPDPPADAPAGSHPPPVQFIVVNLTQHKKVRIITSAGVGEFRARGNCLRKRYSSALVYFDGEHWFGQGDLESMVSLNIKDVATDYTFTPQDEDKILHFVHETEGVKITLPNPMGNSGAQFFVHNISEGWVEIVTEGDAELKARARFLRRKYDDAAIYTDGTSWFATGDLS